jgi:hypothetical protein
VADCLHGEGYLGAMTWGKRPHVDFVNIAAQLEPLAEPGGIGTSDQVYISVRKIILGLGVVIFDANESIARLAKLSDNTVGSLAAAISSLARLERLPWLSAGRNTIGVSVPLTGTLLTDDSVSQY